MKSVPANLLVMQAITEDVILVFLLALVRTPAQEGTDEKPSAAAMAVWNYGGNP